jgi:hypothetical protein
MIHNELLVNPSFHALCCVVATAVPHPLPPQQRAFLISPTDTATGVLHSSKEISRMALEPPQDSSNLGIKTEWEDDETS